MRHNIFSCKKPASDFNNRKVVGGIASAVSKSLADFLSLNMEQQNLFKGRDKRKKGWFWMDNDYLNGYAQYFGAIGTAIYVSLCRHSNNENQKCFPAMETIAEEVGISENTVRKYIHLFGKYKIIGIEKERDYKTKKWLNNIYTLLDKTEWIKPDKPLWKSKRKKSHSQIDKTRCLLCGVSVVEKCHFIPKSQGGFGLKNNTIYLCPTHHTILDRGEMNEDDINKIKAFLKPSPTIGYGSNNESHHQPLSEPSPTIELTHHQPLVDKETNINKTNIKDVASNATGKEINFLIDLFKEVNPNYEQLFERPPQRAAVERMVKKWGYEKMENGIKFLPQIFGKRYAPTITTPIQLENKMGELIGYIKKQRSGDETKKSPIIK